MVKPLISYPGAKNRFYEHMKPYFPLDMEVYVEPFFGGGSVGLNVAADGDFQNIQRMVVGDLAPEIWALWQGVKVNPSAVEEIATRWYKEKCPHAEELAESGFDAELYRRYTEGDKKDWKEKATPEVQSDIRCGMEIYEIAIKEAMDFWEWSQSLDTTVHMKLEERAARTLLVNRFSFSGMGDSGSLSKDRFCAFRLESLNRVYETSELLNRMEILNASFEDTMKFAYDKPEKSFVFLDPPYWKQEASGLYGRNGDTHRGFPHEKFAECTKALPCKWFVTYDDSVKVRQMFEGCYLKPFRIGGGYVMAMRASEDALAGEELFIANYELDKSNESLMDLL
jgi:DNA adenine methylase